ncbi:hypothetical protein MXD60_02620 [Frankia sp. AgB32]|nr:hypothetical protein [Frankia sp. AgB32]
MVAKVSFLGESEVLHDSDGCLAIRSNSSGDAVQVENVESEADQPIRITIVVAAPVGLT